ncbi:hypothetical protein [Sediminicurvatus halobius]|uniref:Uncharacterized protein n=1 Tax=Sediminicurvatus halobius TaxID=2182432 RepID=A0A2U2MY68_9GAMM|nr:hypothetical protein [Spiribacter halobius]PWG61743.1 hypothetical protein DEM34_14855 [Spiribacter halobius]UEX76827.1 hypothetical protein LMH63_12765 [Spiribacter halobius]
MNQTATARPLDEPRLDELWDSTVARYAYEGGPLAAEARAELVRRGLAETASAPAEAVHAVIQGNERRIEHALGELMRAAVASQREGRASVFVTYFGHVNAVDVYARRVADTSDSDAFLLKRVMIDLTGPLSDRPADRLYELAARIDALHSDMEPGQ